MAGFVKDTSLEDAVMRGEMSVFDFCCQKVEGQIERMIKLSISNNCWS